MFGDIASANALTVVGTAASGGTGARLQLVDFVSDASTVELSILKAGQRFVLTGASPNIVTVDRVDENDDSDWLGWGAGFETRSEERRVGKECRARGARED